MSKLKFSTGLKRPFGRKRIGVVYFIQRGDDGPIKIGFSTNPSARLRTLQTAHTEELKIIYAFPGSASDEDKLHAKFKQFNENGEWFRPDTAIFKHIHKLKAKSAPSE